LFNVEQQAIKQSPAASLIAGDEEENLHHYSLPFSSLPFLRPT